MKSTGNSSSPLIELKNLAAKRPDTVYLSFCDPPAFGFGPPRTVQEALERMNIRDLSPYPDFRGMKELIEALVTRVKQWTGAELPADRLLVTNGVSESFQFIGMVAKNGKFLVQDPFYFPMVEIFRQHGHVLFYPCTEEENWYPDTDKLRQMLKDSKADFLTVITPNNPTGAVYPLKVLKELADMAGEYNAVLVTNEIYDGFTTEPDQFVSGLKACKDVPVIYLNGFSKVYRLPGMRIGYMGFHDPDEKEQELWNRVSYLARLRLGVNAAGQKLALAALEEPASKREEIFDRLWKQRKELTRRIETSQFLRTVPSRGSTFIFPEVPVDDLELCRKLLAEHGFFAYPGSSFGQQGQKHLSLVFLETTANLLKGMDAIETTIRGLT